MSEHKCFECFPLIHSFHKSILEKVYLKNFIAVHQIALRSKNESFKWAVR